VSRCFFTFIPTDLYSFESFVPWDLFVKGRHLTNYTKYINSDVALIY
jgi:hypothetical protein